MKTCNVLIVCNLSKLHGVGTHSIRMSRLNTLDNFNIVYYNCSMPSSYAREYISLNNAQIINAENTMIQSNIVVKYIRLFCNFIYLTNIKKKLFQVYTNKYIPDIIYSVSSETLALSFLIQYIFPNSKLVTAVLHPGEYSWKPNRQNLFSIFTKRLIQCLPSENIFSMNESVLYAHKTYVSKSEIVPIFIDIERFLIKRTPNKRKVLSVGQIIPFKTYNFYMLDVIKNLISAGYDYEYHIYGHGTQVNELIEEIKNKSLENVIFFHGEIGYDDLPSVFADAYVFIGMGTTIIEASASGIPSILASPTKKAVSYGWFFDQKDYNVGEFLADKCPSHNVENMLKYVYNISDLEYKCLSEKSIEKARSFSFDSISKIFVEKIFNARENNKINIRGWLLFIRLEKLLHKIFKRTDPNLNRRNVIQNNT